MMMDMEESAAEEKIPKIAASQVALISAVACGVFLCGMLSMYFLVTGYRVASYSSPDPFGFLAHGLWSGLVWPFFRATQDLFVTHGFYVVAILVLAGDRIFNALVFVYDALQEYRVHLLVFTAGALSMILLASALSLQTRTGGSFPCVPGQMLTAGGDCLWINRY
ncbi:MAG: hypothetical protein KA099_10600 [Alphaproteobacteria bacterium]|nr:hypothetical protein [Alphaproteobacteria bacterium]MBP7758507.1 hypothetical protein [Alphaproteobacteria bacterium]MBP7761940.1 hypothetical protein [Alphaproteobacteria bacterium]MBP7905764.1 hypothetical protein [Alphaproteobacteria bacterium]